MNILTKQHGTILITSLIIVLVLTSINLALMRTSVTEVKIRNNLHERSLATQASENLANEIIECLEHYPKWPYLNNTNTSAPCLINADNNNAYQETTIGSNKFYRIKLKHSNFSKQLNIYEILARAVINNIDDITVTRVYNFYAVIPEDPFANNGFNTSCDGDTQGCKYTYCCGSGLKICGPVYSSLDLNNSANTFCGASSLGLYPPPGYGCDFFVKEGLTETAPCENNGKLKSPPSCPTNNPYSWDAVCNQCPRNLSYDSSKGKCVKCPFREHSLDGTTCVCKGSQTRNPQTNLCECGVNQDYSFTEETCINI